MVAPIEKPLYLRVVDQYERTKRFGLIAMLTEEQKNRIPQESYIDCVLEDSKTGKTYPAKVYVAWECYGEFWGLMEYMVYWHYCGCHRANSIVGDDRPEEEDGECDCSRFLVKSVTDSRIPGVNLYYESRELIIENADSMVTARFTACLSHGVIRGS